MSEGDNELLQRWRRLASKPGGRWLFSVLLGRMAPYTSSIRPRVEELRPGYARVRMRDRRGLRNHLRSLHAIALMNLAEVASGLAMLAAMPSDARAILTGLSIDYTKKGRGTLVAEGNAPRPSTAERAEHLVEAVIRDRDGEQVARATARWLVGPR